MGFQSNAVTSQSAQPRNENWKAQGFINLYLPRKNGSRAKLGAIPLKASRDNDRRLLEWLNEDPSRVSVIMDKLIMEYQSAEQSDDAQLDL